MDALQIASLMIVLAGLFGSINYFFLHLPSSIGILIVALIASISIMGLDLVLPDLGLSATIRIAVEHLEFSDTLLDGMLGLLLFAGALHVKVSDLKTEGWTVALMATIGVLISTVIAGMGLYFALGVPLLIALIFGALISPTDPVAVLGVLREANLRKSLETQIAGESLFNDGVGYVVFLFLVGLAFPVAGHGEATVSSAFMLFGKEALGGAALGGFLGWVVFLMMKRIDDYPLEVLLSLGLAFGGYQLAVMLGVSGPIMAVVAGLLIGDVGVKYGMSQTTREYLNAFWKLVDEILNALLFLLIGVEVFAVAFELEMVMAGLLGIFLSLLARLAAVALPIFMLSRWKTYRRDVIPIMTWGGLKGGISVALALSLPPNEWKPLILTITYIVVLFSIIVQGLSIAPLARRLNRGENPP
ncbi:MAG: sodium:proton antiporter [Rhodobacteraceae bacterium]|nr:sodium:proton antiporter [Paracoccaceae bacterium]